MGNKPPLIECFTPPEDDLFEKGYKYVAGIDEAGRGPLAGPVVAAAVIFPKNHSLRGSGTLDSKKMLPVRREKVFKMIQSLSLAVAFGIVDQWEIDRINIHRASLKAMEIAASNLYNSADYLLIDGLHKINSSLPQLTVKHGDFISPLIGSASVIAKVIRDRIMEKYHQLYPGYNFAKNKGYGTEEHREAIRRYGYCSLHRKTFRGVVFYQDLIK
ncbi:MAG: ribonuclease HII [Proteobacteria bacterium]|nr:ribonuclease HII [Pseudomonadota bacterium]